MANKSAHPACITTTTKQQTNPEHSPANGHFRASRRCLIAWNVIKPKVIHAKMMFAKNKEQSTMTDGFRDRSDMPANTSAASKREEYRAGIEAIHAIV